MHAIIRQGDGKYYISTVYGYYRDITATDKAGKYHQYISNPYWIVWDPEKKRLIRWKNMVQNTTYLIPQTLIIDSEHDNWVLNDEGEGCVKFLSRELLDSFLDKENQPEDILEKCLAMDAEYVYNDTPEIKTQKDIDDLDWVSGNFHDAYIEKEELLPDGTLHLLFDGIWGCKIEVWFWGDLEYDTNSRNPRDYDPYWQSSTLLLKDGFVYFIDEENVPVDEIFNGYCYFKARHMKYRVIPD